MTTQYGAQQVFSASTMPDDELELDIHSYKIRVEIACRVASEVYKEAQDARLKGDKDALRTSEQILQAYAEKLLAPAYSGHKGALYVLGLMHGSGVGVKKNRAKAADMFRIWRGKSSAEEKYNLGLLYSTGGSFLLDNSAANRWFYRAADEGYAEAQYKLAERNWDGMAGVGNPKTVEYWLKCAAAQGHTDALRQLRPGYRLARFCLIVVEGGADLLREWLRRRW